jgi:hypothetical protein
MLARTTALGFGYLPARGVTMPPDLAWLRPVLRNGVTPAVLLMILILLVCCPRRGRIVPANLTTWMQLSATPEFPG